MDQQVKVSEGEEARFKHLLRQLLHRVVHFVSAHQHDSFRVMMLTLMKVSFGKTRKTFVEKKFTVISILCLWQEETTTTLWAANSKSKSSSVWWSGGSGEGGRKTAWELSKRITLVSFDIISLCLSPLFTCWTLKMMNTDYTWQILSSVTTFFNACTVCQL